MPKKNRSLWDILFNREQSDKQITGKVTAIRGRRSQELTSALPKTTARNNSVTLPNSNQGPLPNTSDDLTISQARKAELVTKGKFAFTKDGRTIPTDPELRAIYDKLTGTLDADTDNDKK